MPRRAKGARLYPRARDGRDPVWVIRDGAHEEGTGCGLGNREGAERALESYLARKYRPGGSSRPSEILISEVLALYQKNVMPAAKRPEMIRYTCAVLLTWWDTKYLADVKGATCRAYTTFREGQRWAKAKTSTRTVSKAGVRRELETLRAAINHYHAEHTLDTVPTVTLPERGRARERWLTRGEAARLLWAAWREPKARHLVRFILIGLYTGTRHDAILRLGWMENTLGGWIDTDAGRIYRRAAGARQTKKRQPPARLPDRLLAHLRRWRRLDEDLKERARREVEEEAGETKLKPGYPFVVTYLGEPLMKERRAFRTACTAAGLGPEVVPHTMRHTAATWLMQAGVDVWQAAGVLGMTAEQLEETYGHHHPDFQKGVAKAF